MGTGKTTSGVASCRPTGRFAWTSPNTREETADSCHVSQGPPISQTAVVPPMSAPSHSTQSLPSSPRIGTSLGVPPLTPQPNAGNNGLRPAGTIPPPLLASSMFASTSARAMSPPSQTVQSKYQGSPLSSQSLSQPSQRPSLPKPNYNISLSDIVANPVRQPPLTAPLIAAPPSQTSQIQTPMTSVFSASLAPPQFVAPQGMGGILTPLKPQQRTPLSGVGANRQISKDILSDFDPLA